MAVPEYSDEDSNDVDIYMNQLVKDEFKVVEESVVETEIERSTCEGNELSVQNLKHDNSIPFPAKPIRRKTNLAVLFCILGCIMMVFKRINWQEKYKRIGKSKIDIEYNFSKHKAKMKGLIEHPKTRSWISKFVKSLNHIPRTIVQTYVLNPQDYCNFIKEQKTGLTSSLKESMQFEWCRLASFANYPYTSISVIRLAEAGFHYEGNANEAVCNSCGLKYKNWKSNDSPVQIHKDNAPQCSFVVINLNTIPRNNDIQIADISVGACGNSSEASNLSVIREMENKAETSSASEKKTNETYSENNVAKDQNRFTIENKVLAGDDCRLETENLENISFPRRTNWEFPAFSRNNITGLISIPENNRALQSSLQSPHTPDPVNSLTSNLEAVSMGVCLEKPKYPKYAIRTTRLSSFTNWPFYLSQTPDELVTAGFFYTGIEDHCRCFFCGGGLRRWEVGDLPWTEHARWYPKCQFVKQCMGEKFIEDVQHGKDPEHISNSSQSEEKIQSKGLNGFTNNPAVQTILEFGYEPDVAKSAYTSLQTAGIQDITASLLFETINEKEEREQKQSACNHSVKSSHQSAHLVKNHTQNTPKDEQANIDPDIGLSVKCLEEENRNLKDQQTSKYVLMNLCRSFSCHVGTWQRVQPVLQR
ncbi:baculoviral IAP repeat-containing protein 2-like isoform X2 [Mytilus californianus]|uniref:baculoviral IAP repeat-containing protein 2-like isoform X2 n=1 Tax=Mytilus californianus TaxID=6549 RepID=UPI002245A8C0|nr:baculoviral IAP repeat-containing protein 2-like isoform X2 [Mytilus californianus]